MRQDTELWGSLRLVRSWGRPQLFITSAEHSASPCERALPLLGGVDGQHGAWCFHLCVGGGALSGRSPWGVYSPTLTRGLHGRARRGVPGHS